MEFNKENQKKVPGARKANFSMLEESILQREVKFFFDVLGDKHSNYVTNLEKAAARIWKDVTTKINALGVAPRTVIEIKDKWRNLTSKNIFNHILTIMITNSFDIYTVTPFPIYKTWLVILMGLNWHMSSINAPYNIGKTCCLIESVVDRVQLLWRLGPFYERVFHVNQSVSYLSNHS